MRMEVSQSRGRLGYFHQNASNATAADPNTMVIDATGYASLPCFNCQEMGHIARNCRKSAKCRFDGLAHATRDCPNHPRRKGRRVNAALPAPGAAATPVAPTPPGPAPNTPATVTDGNGHVWIQAGTSQGMSVQAAMAQLAELRAQVEELKQARAEEGF